MLRTDLVPSRHLRNNRSRAIRRRDNPALLFLGPATPAANTSPDFNTPKRPPRIVKYIVDHICEPISPNRSTSDELSAPPQGAVKTPLSVYCRATPHDALPCLRKPVSSITSTASSSAKCSMPYARTISRRASASQSPRPRIACCRMGLDRQPPPRASNRSCAAHLRADLPGTVLHSSPHALA